MVVRVVAGPPLIRRPEHAQHEPTDAELVTRANDLHDGSSISGGQQRSVPIFGCHGKARVEHPSYVE